MTTITATIDETQWQFALDRANAANSAKNEAANRQGSAAAAAAKPPVTFTPTVFVPQTLVPYAQAILDGIGANYAKQQSAQHLATISTLSPSDLALVAKLAGQPDTVLAPLRATVTSLSAPVIS